MAPMTPVVWRTTPSSSGASMRYTVNEGSSSSTSRFSWRHMRNRAAAVAYGSDIGSVGSGNGRSIRTTFWGASSRRASRSSGLMTS